MQHTLSTISTEQTESGSTYQLKFCTMRPLLPNAKQLKPLNTTGQRPRGRRRRLHWCPSRQLRLPRQFRPRLHLQNRAQDLPPRRLPRHRRESIDISAGDDQMDSGDDDDYRVKEDDGESDVEGTSESPASEGEATSDEEDAVDLSAWTPFDKMTKDQLSEHAKTGWTTYFEQDSTSLQLPAAELAHASAALTELAIAVSWMDNRPLVKDYQDGMGGADLHGQLRSQRYTIQYYLTIFLGLIDMALINVYIIYRSVQAERAPRKAAPTHAELKQLMQTALLGMGAANFEGDLSVQALVDTPVPPSPTPRYTLPGRHTTKQVDTYRVTRGKNGNETRKRRQFCCKVCSLLQPGKIRWRRPSTALSVPRRGQRE
ncbi:hypothetical protein PF010_g13090 [Phytophthora fragariae]|uniref:PiggyBac transposable element-derived protein domain-containing protein n=2 Tax=Phytophthora fragariae TaxID=53985 RepID=A0A6G0P0B2_9STRA|nr:hypothetical protein PF010_g13090 [Phytophthora fragariae]KAE9229964.1 hypothetical protein PF004_g10629 [Phytophthora fragariae]